jgi:phage terminase small subunit
MSGHGEKIEQKQERAISALLQAESIREAAKEAGIAEATLHRWLKDDSFKEAYRMAKHEVVNHAICQVQRSTGKAVKALVEITEDKESPASARVSAAKTILETSIKAIELEDLERRISELEKLIKERNSK